MKPSPPHPSRVERPEAIAARRAQLIDRFTPAWQAKHLDGLMALMSDSCSFRGSVGVEPGTTFEGRAEVRRGFELFLRGGSNDQPAETDAEPPLICEDFAVTRWTTRYPQLSGPPVVVRACDIFGFAGDRITFKDTYRKLPGELPA